MKLGQSHAVAFQMMEIILLLAQDMTGNKGFGDYRMLITFLR